MDHFNHVFASVGQLDAVCCCEPPGARGGSDLPWYHKILNLIGVAKVRRAEAEVYLGLRDGNLVYVAFNDEQEVVSQAAIPLATITGGKVTPKGEWSHAVSFVVDGTTHDHVTCGYLFGASGGTPAELQPKVKQMEQAVIDAIAARS
jgi:hypothetical protein